jgi:hypothetical protein
MPPPLNKPLYQKPSLPPPPNSQVSTRTFKLGGISKALGHRALLYGPGGIGKTTLASQAPGPCAFVDSDESLPRLKSSLEELSISLPGVAPVSDWPTLRAALQSEGWPATGTVILDSITKIEEWCIAETLKKVKKEGGGQAHNIEDYGYGKGYQHTFDTFLPLLGDLDRLCRKGLNVILIAHECVNTVPNPEGEDWVRYEPRLQNPASGKASIRLRIKEWADHVLFLGYDVAVEKGVGKGAGTKTIYTSERPHFMAKSRSTQESFPLDGNAAEIWATILR